MNIAQIFGYIRNKKFNLHTWYIYFSDQIFVIFRSEKFAKRHRYRVDLLFMNANRKSPNIAHAQNIRILEPPPTSTLPRNLRWSEMRCLICRSDLYN